MDIRFRRDYSRANGYKLDGADSILPGAKEYIDRIPGEDRIAILTSRTDEDEDGAPDPQ